MDHFATVTLLSLKQGDRSLEVHLEEFLSLAHKTTLQMTASARFYMWDLTTPLERSCLGNLLKGASPTMWSGC